jgi:putative transcriptional regulator
MQRDGVAERITAFRWALGDTQEQFARRVGVTFSTVSRWENGHIRPSRLAWGQLRNLAQQHGLEDPSDETLVRPSDAPGRRDSGAPISPVIVPAAREEQPA